jgi:hypothetical protein
MGRDAARIGTAAPSLVRGQRPIEGQLAGPDPSVGTVASHVGMSRAIHRLFGSPGGGGLNPPPPLHRVLLDRASANGRGVCIGEVARRWSRGSEGDLTHAFKITCGTASRGLRGNPAGRPRGRLIPLRRSAAIGAMAAGHRREARRSSGNGPRREVHGFASARYALPTRGMTYLDPLVRSRGGPSRLSRKDGVA